MIQTTRNRLRRLPERGSHEWTAVTEILDAGSVAFVGFAVDQQPFVIPTLYGRNAETLYRHGSAAGRMMRELSTGVPACVTVALVDGIVLARSAFHHSMNYRSVAAFGTATKINDVDEKGAALKVISDHVLREAGLLFSLDAPNDFPQLPVRTDGPFLVWLGVMPNERALENGFLPLEQSARKELQASALVAGPIELVILTPTRRSRLHWVTPQ